MQSKKSEKSLISLCQRFIKYFPTTVYHNQSIIVCIDRMAQVLEVEKRRIYDITNVLESLEILSRRGKNEYLWHGFSHLNDTLSKLKTLALQSDFLEHVKNINEADQYERLNEDSNSNEHNHKFVSEGSYCNKQKIKVSNEENSIGIKSQKLLMLFLISEDELISVKFATRVLLGQANEKTEQDSKNFKSKKRRIYDIVNILSTIGLCKKVESSALKTVYEYTGPYAHVIQNAEFDYLESKSTRCKQSLFDYIKMDLDLNPSYKGSEENHQSQFNFYNQQSLEATQNYWHHYHYNSLSQSNQYAYYSTLDSSHYYYYNSSFYC